MGGGGALQMDGLMAFATLASPHPAPLHHMMDQKAERTEGRMPIPASKENEQK